MKPVLTVGLDGSPESLAAARWGAAAADRQGLALRLLHAWVPLAPGPRRGSAESDQHYWAQRILHDAHVELHKHYPVLSIVEDLVANDAPSPVHALLPPHGECHCGSSKAAEHRCRQMCAGV